MKTLIFLIGLTCVIASCEPIEDPVPVVVPDPEFLSLIASPETIQYGGTSTIIWDVINSIYCTVNGKKMNISDSLKVKLTSTTTYEVVAVGEGNKKTTKEITIVVAKPGVPVITVTVPESIPYGTATTFSWKIKGIVTSTTLNGKAVSDSSFTTSILYENKEYTIIVTGPGGSVTEKVTILVEKASAPVITVTVPETIPYGTSTFFHYKVKGFVNTLTIGGSYNPTDSGAYETGFLYKNTEYVIVATGPGGTATKKVTIGVTPYVPTRTDTICSRPWFLKALDVWRDGKWETDFVLLEEMKTSSKKFDAQFLIGYRTDGSINLFTEWKWSSPNGIIIGDQTYTYVLTDTSLVLYQTKDGDKLRNTYWRP